MRDLLLDTGKALTEVVHSRDVSGKVRLLQDQLREASADPSSRCLAFFLDLIIDDIFYNLSGDSEYSDNINEVQDIIYNKLGVVLTILGQQEQVFDSRATWDALCQFVNSYLDQLNRLRRESSKKEENK